MLLGTRGLLLDGFELLLYALCLRIERLGIQFDVGQYLIKGLYDPCRSPGIGVVRFCLGQYADDIKILTTGKDQAQYAQVDLDIALQSQDLILQTSKTGVKEITYLGSPK